jgi:hypothetical protein
MQEAKFDDAAQQTTQTFAMLMGELQKLQSGPPPTFTSHSSPPRTLFQQYFFTLAHHVNHLWQWFCSLQQFDSKFQHRPNQFNFQEHPRWDDD